MDKKLSVAGHGPIACWDAIGIIEGSEGIVRRNRLIFWKKQPRSIKATIKAIPHSIKAIKASRKALEKPRGFTAAVLINGGYMKNRDLEKKYSVRQLAAKLRRLADSLETGERFSIQIAGERVFVPAAASASIEHEREGSSEEIEFQLKWSNAKKGAKTKKSLDALPHQDRCCPSLLQQI